MSRDRRDADFTAFVEAHSGALLRTAQFLTGDRWLAEDLVQTALTKTYLAWPTAKSPLPYAYARKVLVNAHTDGWRRRRWREQSTQHDHMPVDEASTDDDPSARAIQDEGIARALANLTPHERAVLVLRFCEDLSERDTARLLGISTGTVKSTSSRALSKVRAEQAKATKGDSHVHR